MNWDTIASIATAFGVGIAAWQIWESRKLAQTTFEDSFDQQYRSLAMQIPVDALIGRAVIDEERRAVREKLYNYLDLCNEQIYLRMKKRVCHARWVEWCDGMKENLEKTAFSEVWEEIKKESPQTFSFLAQLEKRSFKCDPAKWQTRITIRSEPDRKNYAVLRKGKSRFDEGKILSD